MKIGVTDEELAALLTWDQDKCYQRYGMDEHCGCDILVRKLARALKAARIAMRVSDIDREPK